MPPLGSSFHFSTLFAVSLDLQLLHSIFSRRPPCCLFIVPVGTDFPPNFSRASHPPLLHPLLFRSQLPPPSTIMHFPSTPASPLHFPCGLKTLRLRDESHPRLQGFLSCTLPISLCTPLPPCGIPSLLRHQRLRLHWPSVVILCPPLSQVKYGMLQLAEGLSFLGNEAGMVHRGLSLESIMITSNGSFRIAGPPAPPLPVLQI